MSEEKLEDVRDTAIKLGAIYSQSPMDYAYLKGWIHCLLQKEESLCNFQKSIQVRRKETLFDRK